MKVYVVKDLNSGLYSTGGAYGHFDTAEKAKRWKQIGHARSWITMYFGGHPDAYTYSNKWYVDRRAAHPNIAIIEVEVRLDEGVVHPHTFK